MKKILLFIITIGSILCVTGCGPKISLEQRFQIIISPHTARQTYLLDTKTGHTWVVAGDGEGTPSEWIKMGMYIRPTTLR